MQKSEARPIGRDVVIQFQPIPSALAQDMRTLDRPPIGTPHEADPSAIGQIALLRLREIETALADRHGRDDGTSALGVSEETNSITRASGLVLRRLRPDGLYTAPLAELVSPTGRLDDDGIEVFDRFRGLAHHWGLRLWIHRTEKGSDVGYVPFIVARESDDAPRMFYLARLFATPYEVDQWRNPLVDGGGGPG